VDEGERAAQSAEIFGLLARIVHRTAQDAAAILARDGLNPAQFQLLRTLRMSPGGTQASLVQHRGVTAGSVSQLVSKLEARRLLRREADGAANRLWLTPAGTALVDRLTPDQDAFFARRFADLSPADLDSLLELTRRAMESLPADG
jgi:DNA-binding MarR family transcriptional regulator